MHCVSQPASETLELSVLPTRMTALMFLSLLLHASHKISFQYSQKDSAIVILTAFYQREKKKHYILPRSGET